MQKWVSNIPVNILRGYGVLNLNEISTSIDSSWLAREPKSNLVDLATASIF